MGWCLLLSCQKVHYVGVSKSTVSVHHNITNQSLLRVKLIRDVVHVLQTLSQRRTQIYTINNSLLSSSCEPELCRPHLLVVRKCAETKAIQFSSGHLFLRRKIKRKGKVFRTLGINIAVIWQHSSDLRSLCPLTSFITSLILRFPNSGNKPFEHLRMRNQFLYPPPNKTLPL